MQKLRVTYQDGPWQSLAAPPPLKTIDLDPHAVMRTGGEMLTFQIGATSRVLLIIPASRLISATAVEVEE